MERACDTGHPHFLCLHPFSMRDRRSTQIEVAQIEPEATRSAICMAEDLRGGGHFYWRAGCERRLMLNLQDKQKFTLYFKCLRLVFKLQTFLRLLRWQVMTIPAINFGRALQPGSPVDFRPSISCLSTSTKVRGSLSIVVGWPGDTKKIQGLEASET